MHSRCYTRLILTLPVLCVLLLANALQSEAAEGDSSLLSVTFLDVRQGDSIWVQTPGGQDLLIDGGPDAAGPRVVAYLRSHGCTDIEHMALTHPHADHVGGLISVVQAIPTRELWYTGEAYSTQTFGRFLELVEDQGITMTIQAAGQVEPIDEIELTVLNPVNLGTNTNDNSLVYRIVYEKTAFLLAGDIEARAEGEILGRAHPLQSDVLKVPHHGSSTSSRWDFLQAVSPAWAAISVGAGNPYGHPSAEVLDRLAALPTTIHRTDLDGTIRVFSDGTTITVDISRKLRFVFLPFVAH